MTREWASRPKTMARPSKAWLGPLTKSGSFFTFQFVTRPRPKPYLKYKRGKK